jgi:hypothetical protein
MSSFNPHHNDLTTYTHQEFDKCNSYPQPHLSNPVNNIDTIANYAHLQNNTGIAPSLVPPSSFSPPYVTLDPLLALYPPQPDIVLQPVLYGHSTVNPHNQAFMSTTCTHHQFTAPTSTLLQQTAMTTPTTVLPPISPVTQTVSTSRRAKFPCPSCGKMLTSWPRAWTCFFKHVGTQPFICNGTCGVQGWSVLWIVFIPPSSCSPSRRGSSSQKRYRSKAHLARHCKENKTECLTWYVSYT